MILINTEFWKLILIVLHLFIKIKLHSYYDTCLLNYTTLIFICYCIPIKSLTRQIGALYLLKRYRTQLVCPAVDFYREYLILIEKFCFLLKLPQFFILTYRLLEKSLSVSNQNWSNQIHISLLLIFI